MNPTPITRVVARIAGFSLAALVTATLLSGVGQVADSQYRDAVLAQSAPQVVPALVVAANEQPGH